MKNTFEQGWASKPFREQFPNLTNKEAERLDRLNHAITDMFLNDLITDSQMRKIRMERFPKVVKKALDKAAGSDKEKAT
jgi:hypothetical protein